MSGTAVSFYGIREEIQAVGADASADRAAMRAETQADRAAFQAEINRLRDEDRADREAYEQHITRLTQGQSRLTGIVEEIRTARR